MNKHVKIKNNKSWKDNLKELRKEYRTATRPCLAMSKELFNQLMREYHIIKPKWSYQKRKKYLQWIIDKNDSRKEIIKDINRNTIYSNLELGVTVHFSGGANHVLELLDARLDNVLDLMGPIDLS